MSAVITALSPLRDNYSNILAILPFTRWHKMYSNHNIDADWGNQDEDE